MNQIDHHDNIDEFYGLAKGNFDIRAIPLVENVSKNSLSDVKRT